MGLVCCQGRGKRRGNAEGAESAEDEERENPHSEKRRDRHPEENENDSKIHRKYRKWYFHDWYINDEEAVKQGS
jgi:hypothetical protein